MESYAGFGGSPGFWGVTPDELRRVMADLAYVFHWQPSELRRLPVEELLEYHRLAVERVKLFKQFLKCLDSKKYNKANACADKAKEYGQRDGHGKIRWTQVKGQPQPYQAKQPHGPKGSKLNMDFINE